MRVHPSRQALGFGRVVNTVRTINNKTMVEDPNSRHKGAESGQIFNHSFGIDLAHDFGGAILFSFPLLMTMEMWWLGFYMDRSRLALFLGVAFLIVMGLSYFEGGEETFKIEILDALVACAAGYVVSGVMLTLFGIIKVGMSFDEIVGKISLHAVPGSIGAILARRQLDVKETKKEKRRQQGYGGKVFLMCVGAIFLAFQLAPTEEMVLIGHRMTGWHAAALALVSLCIMQAFICSVERSRGRQSSRPDSSGPSCFASQSSGTPPRSSSVSTCFGLSGGWMARVPRNS